jgi:glycosyltransferase involved in cell wall biosynthesis
MRICKRVKAFLPEMTSINNSLINNYDFKNTEVFPNFRKFKKDLFSKNCSDGLRLVFLARIQKKKGYPIIMRCADYFRKNDLKVTVDFYGQVSDDERRDFISGISNNNDFFRYYGELKPEDIQKTLCEYDALILPTQYYTEGFPGSVLDAFIAGIPVIVTEWKHSHEFVEDGKTGFIIPFNDNYESLLEKIMILYNNRDTLTGMKENAKEEREKYSIETAWNVLSKYIGSEKK